jgi:hypothetical protein
MIKYDRIIKAQNDLVKYWGDDGKKVIEMCFKSHKSNMSLDTFLSDYCTACGGNWGGMLLSGVRRLYPDVWDAIPKEMGSYAWVCICAVLILLGIEAERSSES